MSEQSKEELKVKDLLVKLQILTNGLLEERNKTKSYLDRIKEYEESLAKKDLEISDLTKEKFDLKSKLTLERSKRAGGKKNDTNYVEYFSSFFNAKPPDDSKTRELEEKINQQNYEIKDLTRRLMEEKESFDQQKIKFQTMLALQTQQMTEFKKKYDDLEKSKNSDNTQNSEKEKEEKLKEEKEREKEKEREEREREKERELERLRREKENEEPKILLSEHKEKIEYLKSQFNSERDAYEKQLGQLKNELREEKEKSEMLNSQLNQFKDKFDSKNIENIAMKSQVSKLNGDLNKLKTDFKNKQLAPRIFHVERIRTIGKQAMVISFNWNKNQSICEMIFKRAATGGKIKEDTINIMDVKFTVNEKNKDTIDISFKVSYTKIKYLIFFIQDNNGEEAKFNVVPGELVYNYFIDSYKEFLKKAKEI